MTLHEEEPVDRWCPTCHARPSDPCMTVTGSPMTGTHIARGKRRGYSSRSI